MTGLHHKLLRDLWRLKAQGFTIALLVACGIASLVSSVASYESLRLARDHFYDTAHLADVFVHLDRAPLPVLDRIRDLPGVAVVEGRVAGDFRLEIKDATEPVVAHFVSLPTPATGSLNAATVLDGHPIETGSSDQILLGDSLAESWHLRPDAELNAIINGRRAKLRLAGLATSPEYLYVMPKAGLLDPIHYGIAWMDGSALARAMGMSGEFNDVAIQLIAGADVQEVIHRVDVLLEPYGGLGAVGREDQQSVRLVDKKIVQQQAMAIFLPGIFLAVSAFLLNVLLTRIVGTQREQIATMKALGYRTRELAVHFLSLSGIICVFGIAMGAGLGVALGRLTLGVYAKYFKFPEMPFHVEWRALLFGTLVALTSSFIGALLAVRRAVAIPPAEAMRPEPPASFKPTLLERMGVHRFLSPAMRMVFRDLERHPLRLALSAGSITLATSIMVVGTVGVDSMEETLRLQYEVSHREDITVTLDKPRSWRAIRDLQRLPGVRNVEGERVVPVRLRAGPISKTTVILGLDPHSDLHLLLGTDKRPLQVPEGGLGLSRALGEELGVQAGDQIEVEVLEGRRQKLLLPVDVLVDDLVGLSGYMTRTRLDALMNEGASADVALLAVDRPALDDLMFRLQRFPYVGAVSRPDLDRNLLKAQVADVYFAMQILLVMFASAIAVGVVYNNARIALEIRSRDLATLRILGFTRGELAVVLLGEQAVQLFLGIWPGLRLGFWLGAKTMASIDKETLRVPPTLNFSAQVTAVCVVLLAAFISALLVRRQSDRLDLVAVLKARD
jgi:putative ABC transport system permease protein